MVRVGCVFVAAFDLSRVWISVSFECDGMHVCTDETSVYTLIWELLGVESEPVLTPEGKSPQMDGSYKDQTWNTG